MPPLALTELYPKKIRINLVATVARVRLINENVGGLRFALLAHLHLLQRENLH